MGDDPVEDAALNGAIEIALERLNVHASIQPTVEVGEVHGPSGDVAGGDAFRALAEHQARNARARAEIQSSVGSALRDGA